jgi:heme O synthase-like polyprenyltransferase
MAQTDILFTPVRGAIPGSIPRDRMGLRRGKRLDMGALILFGILFLWQMPTLGAGARYRADYAAGGFPWCPETVRVGPRA